MEILPEEDDDDAEEGKSSEETIESDIRLNDERMATVLSALKSSGAEKYFIGNSCILEADCNQ